MPVSWLLNITVIVAPADTVMVLLSNAMFFADRLIVVPCGVDVGVAVGEDAGVEVGVDVGVVVGVEVAVGVGVAVGLDVGVGVGVDVYVVDLPHAPISTDEPRIKIANKKPIQRHVDLFTFSSLR